MITSSRSLGPVTGHTVVDHGSTAFVPTFGQHAATGNVGHDIMSVNGDQVAEFDSALIRNA